MINKFLFLLAHQSFDMRFYPLYNEFIQNDWLQHDELLFNQEIQLRKMIHYAYNKVPYYKDIFDNIGMSPNAIQTVQDLKILPLLTKDLIKTNWEKLKPIGLKNIPHYMCSTGGTTGTPMIYRNDKYNRLLGRVLLYRGWSKAGFRLCDRCIMLGGESLIIRKNKENINHKIQEIALNIKKLSSFDMGIKEMKEYFSIINSYKPKFIRGYPSALYFFSMWIQNNELNVHYPMAVITTSEKLYPNMRTIIERVFGCKVFDSYGLHDGSLGAYECSQHEGLHIDSERSVLEVVDDKGEKLNNGVGRVLATSLYNYSMPFIRYDTGDVAEITEDDCTCGRGHRLLKDVVGRTVDIFKTPEGKYVHGWFFLYIFWDYGKGIKEYQVSQVSERNIVIKIVPEKNFDYSIVSIIEKIIKDKSKKWNVEFEYVDEIRRTASGKFKFIINELNNSVNNINL